MISSCINLVQTHTKQPSISTYILLMQSDSIFGMQFKQCANIAQTTPQGWMGWSIVSPVHTICCISTFLIDSQMIWWNICVLSTTWSKRSQMKHIPVAMEPYEFKHSEWNISHNNHFDLFINMMTSPFSEP